MDMCILRTSLFFSSFRSLFPLLLFRMGGLVVKKLACVRPSSVLISLAVVFALVWAVIIVAFPALPVLLRPEDVSSRRTGYPSRLAFLGCVSMTILHHLFN